MGTAYTTYMRSDAWRETRQKRLVKDKHKCRTCGKGESLQVHHVTYERFTRERQADLITLCKECHDAITDVIRRNRYSGKKLQSQNIKPVEVFYSEKLESKIDWNRATDHAQQCDGGPAELLRRANGASQKQKAKDGGRPRTNV